MEESPGSEPKGRPGVRFCPYCFMQQFQVSDRIEGSVYCEVCGIDIPVKDLVNL
jgi:hypothetical protein